MVLVCYVLVTTKLVRRDLKSYGLSSLQAGKGLNLCAFNPASWERIVFEGSEASHDLASVRAYGAFLVYRCGGKPKQGNPEANHAYQVGYLALVKLS